MQGLCGILCQTGGRGDGPISGVTASVHADGSAWENRRVLFLHRAERADRLAEALGALLASPLPDPFAAEVVSVPTRGMERWLAQRLSGQLGAGAGRADGICAGVRVPFPQRLLGDVVAAASGIDPVEDP